MKKLISSLIALLLIFAVSTSVFAATPRWSNIAGISGSISPSSGIYTGTVVGNNGTSKIVCTVVLYEKGWFGSTSEVSRISKTFYEQSGSCVGNYSYTTGKTYRIDVTATVYINGVGETVTSSFEKTA